MLSKKRNVFDEMLGTGFHFYGANITDKIIRLKSTDEGEDFWFKVEMTPKDILDITRLDSAPVPLPRGCKHKEPVSRVILYEYNKQDNIHHAVIPTEAVWNKGYMFIDVDNGHPWLRVGLHNFKSSKGIRAVFLYGALDNDDEDEDVSEE